MISFRGKYWCNSDGHSPVYPSATDWTDPDANKKQKHSLDHLQPRSTSLVSKERIYWSTPWLWRAHIQTSQCAVRLFPLDMTHLIALLCFLGVFFSCLDFLCLCQEGICFICVREDRIRNFYSSICSCVIQVDILHCKYTQVQLLRYENTP